MTGGARLRCQLAAAEAASVRAEGSLQVAVAREAAQEEGANTARRQAVDAQGEVAELEEALRARDSELRKQQRAAVEADRRARVWELQAGSALSELDAQREEAALMRVRLAAAVGVLVIIKKIKK
jgi:ATPase subunit of ABC transporter with duplicated ATPase domains